MKKKIINGFITTISFICIFFFVKYQILNWELEWYWFGLIGLLVFVLADNVAKQIEDRNQKLFMHGIMITASSVFFFSAFSKFFTNEFMSLYSIFLLLGGIILYLFKENITNLVINNGG